ncbi:SICAvar, type I (fragment), partial [Plasmodium knowlesi strain H]
MASGAGDGLLQKWLEQHASMAAAGSAEERAKKITIKLKSDLGAAWDKLRASLSQGEAQEMTDLCSKERTWSSERGSTNEQEYLKDLCKAVVELRYFTAGGGTVAVKQLNFDKNISQDQWYPRCVVGALALSELYGDHCHLEKVVKEISSKVEEKLGGHTETTGNLGRCRDITRTDIMLARGLLHNEIQQWTKEKRDKGSSGGWRIGQLWEKKWKPVCLQGGRMEEAKKHYLEENKATVVSFSGLNNDVDPKSGQLSTIADILTKPELTLNESIVEQALTASLEGNGTSFKAEVLTQVLEKETQNRR